MEEELKFNQIVEDFKNSDAEAENLENYLLKASSKGLPSLKGSIASESEPLDLANLKVSLPSPPTKEDQSRKMREFHANHIIAKYNLK